MTNHRSNDEECKEKVAPEGKNKKSKRDVRRINILMIKISLLDNKINFE